MADPLKLREVASIVSEANDDYDGIVAVVGDDGDGTIDFECLGSSYQIVLTAKEE